MNQAKAVEKINELTQDIMEVSTRTNLLALNASIEAARAGEAGKGFAVVASEIGVLASQTQDTVKGIDDITSQVNEAVTNMKGCLDETMDFLENTVLKDYQNFMGVGENYSSDASYFEMGMNKVNKGIKELVEAIDHISFSIREINTTVNESAVGVTDIAEKTSSMVVKLGVTDSVIESSKESAGNLNYIVKEFKIEK